MALSNKTSKILVVTFLSMLFISTKSTKAVADSKLQLNANEQIQFLEEKRRSQGLIIGERQQNAVVEDMLTYKDIEEKRKTEIVKENEIKREQRKETDKLSEMVKSIRKLQSKKHQYKQLVHFKSVNQTTKTDSYYKDTDISIDEEINNIIPESLKGLIDKPVADRDPMDMDDSDIEMLERIVMAESGGEPYLGQVAVANVVLNRVKSNRYPSTLEGVIFQKSQFSPVKNGVIRGRAPNESVKKAVAEALNGKMIVPEDTLYFVNPVLATDQTVPRTKTPVKIIGSHTFYK